MAAPAAATIRAPYQRTGYWPRHRAAAYALLILLAIIYGFLFSVGTTYILVQLLIPVALFAVLVILMLPDTGKIFARPQELFLFGFVLGLGCWPDYVALAPPGMPWITVIRLTTGPLAFIFLLNLSQASAFRRDLFTIIEAVPWVWRLFLIVTLISLISIAFSSETTMSANKLMVFVLAGVFVFFVAAYVFAQPGRIGWLAALLWATVVFACLIGIWEARKQMVPWAASIPSFLKIDPITLHQIMASKARAATGIYRVQSKFTTPMALAEYIAFTVPFILHFMVTARRIAVRIAAFLTLPLIVYTLVQTDSRLGFVGFFLACLIYLLAWGALRWKRDRESVFGPLVVISYPVVFVTFILATFFVGRLRALVWGTGAQSFSTEAREDQVAQGLVLIAKQPWGYGLGRAAETLGFRDLNDLLTIDSFYLSVALDLGVLGFIAYYAIFGIVLWQAALVALKQYDRDTSYIVPLFIALANFVVIKSISSQQENHPLIFMFVGAAVALIYLIKRNEASPRVPA